MKIEVREKAASRGLTDQGYQTHTNRTQKTTPTNKLHANNKSLFLSSRKRDVFIKILVVKSGLPSLTKLRV
jgi:hypothetical protein